MTSVHAAKGDIKKRLGIGLAVVFFALSPSATISAQPRTSDQKSPYESAVRQPSTDQERELFRSSMLQIPPPGVSRAQPDGCFIAEYPNRKWIKVQCGTPSKYPNAPKVGKGNDFFAQPTGTITKVTGSFPSVFGGLSETGQVQNSAAQCSTGTEFECAANTYVLQLNTNRFSPTSVCGTSTSCSVWEQFLFSNHNQCGLSACVFIEYWIFNPPGLAPKTCPTAAWTYSSTPGTRAGCVLNTPPTLLPHQSSAVLGQLQLTGQIIGGGVDQVSIAPPPEPGKPFTVYAATWGDVVSLSGNWKGAEYNLFGDCCGLEAFFNSKTTINVSLQSTSGTTSAPSCASSFTGATAETNSLSLVANSCSAAGGASPAITFLESNACITPSCSLPVTISYHQVGACNGFETSSGETAAGGNAAYVIFGIDSIDNSIGAAAFSFDPTNLFVQQAAQVDFFDPGLKLYPNILGPLAGAATTAAPGAKLNFSVPGYGALVVTTNNANGAAEASTTSFSLLYSQQPNDPPVNLVNSNPSVTDFTPWPLTEDCHSVQLQ